MFQFFPLEQVTTTTVDWLACWVLLSEAVKVALTCSDALQMDGSVTWEHFMCVIL